MKFLPKLITYFTGIIFIVPLVVIPSSFIFPFIVPKILLFRSTVLLLLFGYLLLLWHQRERYIVRLTPLTVVVSLFFLSIGISTFVGEDWYRSFWDNHERMLGFFTLLHVWVYYLILTTVVKELRDWRWLMRVFLVFGGIVMFLGLWQKFVDPSFLLNRGGTRVSSTLGNAIYFSGFGFFLFFLGFVLTLKEEKKVWKIWSGILSVLGFLGIFAGGTRGTIVALIISAGLSLLLYSIFLKEHRKTRVVLRVVMVLGMVGIIALFVFRSTALVQNIPGIGRLVNTSLSSETADTRIMAWAIAIDAWKESPIFGWGPNNYYYAFNKYYQPGFLLHGWGETWFDNAHNVLMNALATTGFVGFFLYIVLFLTVLVVLFRLYTKKNIHIHEFAGLSAFLVGHFIHNLFVFENPTSFIYFFFILGYINSRYLLVLPKKENKVKENNRNVLPFTVLLGFIIFVVLYTTNINPAKANKATLQAIRALHENKNPSEIYTALTHVSTPHIDDIRNDFSRAVMEKIRSGQMTNKEVGDAILLVEDALRANVLLHPKDIRVHLQMAELFQIAAQLEKNPERLLEAEGVLLTALKFSPKRQQIQYMLSGIWLQLGKYEDAIHILKDSVKNEPKVAEGWWRMVMVYVKKDDIASAQATVNEAKEQGIIFTEEQQRFMAQVPLVL